MYPRSVGGVLLLEGTRWTEVVQELLRQQCREVREVAQGQAEGQEACGQLDDISYQQLGPKGLNYGKRDPKFI